MKETRTLFGAFRFALSVGRWPLAVGRCVSRGRTVDACA